MEHRELLEQIFLALVPEGLRFIRRNLKETVASVSNNLVMSCFNVMDSLVHPYIRHEGEKLNTVSPGSSYYYAGMLACASLCQA